MEDEEAATYISIVKRMRVIVFSNDFTGCRFNEGIHCHKYVSINTRTDRLQLVHPISSI
jgi:hypothetical protein